MKSITLKFALFSVLMTGTAMAQVPSTRPGLNVTPPSTSLVQHDYSGTNQTGTGTQTNSSTNDMFYIDDKSSGPENLANGLNQYNTDRMNQAGQQLSGDYGAMQRNSISGAGSAFPEGHIQEAWKRPLDHMSQGQSAPGTIRYQWSADLVMPVRLRAGMVTSIVLPEWEAAQDVVIGDGTTIEASIVRANQIAVKSVRTGLDTSLNVVGGSGNVYTFYLRTEGRNTTLLTDLQVFVQASPAEGSGEWFNKGGKGWFTSEARNIYTENGEVSPQNINNQGSTIHLSGAASQGDEEVPVDRRIYNMKMYEVNEGDSIIAPEYVFTDGRFTYMHFPAGMTDRPAVFRVVDGTEGRVNTRTSGRHSEVMIAEALGDFVLRSGRRAICLKQVTDDDQVVNRR